VTTIAEARKTVYTTVLNSGIMATDKIALDNEAFEAPIDGSSWMRVAVRNNGSEKETLGPYKYERRASAYVQIFVPVDAGLTNATAANNADALATSVRDLFEGKSLSGLNFAGVLIREGRPDGRWFLVVVDAPFNYHEHRPAV
jgi:hypothetical protein